MIPILALAALAAAPALAAPRAQYPHVEETSFKAADGSRTLEQSVVIDAPAAVLWRAYVEPGEFARWNAPVEYVDLRVGGSIEASYDPKARIGDSGNIKHRLITYLPERLLVFQTIQTPKTFPHPEVFQKTVIMVRYEPITPERTRVFVDVSGWGDSADDDQLYGFFRAGDASLLEKMRDVYNGSPVAAPATPSSAPAAQVHDASFKSAGDQRSLQEWIDISAPPACVWSQLTDEAAIKSSGMGMAHVELKNGGLLEEGFTADAKPAERIRHRIVTYRPERLMVLRNISTGPGLPGGELYPTIVQAITLEPRGAGVTRLTIAHTGYGVGEGYDKLYAFFRQGNAGYLTAVRKACEAPAAAPK